MKYKGSKVYIWSLMLLIALTGAMETMAADIPSFAPLGRIEEGLSAPSRMDADAKGNLYVADPRKKAVLRFSPSGEPKGQFTSAQVSGSGLAVSPDGRFLFVSAGNQVNILDTAEDKIAGFLGKGADEFGAAGSIALDASGFVFVADTKARLIKVYELKTADGVVFGDSRYQFGQGRFASIFTLAIHADRGEVYVADGIGSSSTSARVDVYSIGGTLLKSITGTEAFGQLSPAFISDIGFDDAGRTYLSDRYNGLIRILSADGKFLGAFAAKGHKPGQLWQPRALAYIPGTTVGSGRLMVSCGDGRIEILGIDGGTTPVAVNNRPSIPQPVSPVGGSETDSATPSLCFAKASDTDGDPLSYQIQIFRNGQPVGEILGLPAGADTFCVTTGTALEENTAYGWSVQAFDGKATSGYSAVQSFFVNDVQEPPTTPLALEPQEAAVIEGTQLLSWKSSADPDPEDHISYRLQIAADADFQTLQADESIEGTSRTLAMVTGFDTLEIGRNYWWRVMAEDNHNLGSAPSAARSFRFGGTLLEVEANMPGARVHLGGNHAYTGPDLGEVPLQLRGLPATVHSIVVERSGFEPAVLQVSLENQKVTKVYVELKPVLIPAKQKARDLRGIGGPVTANGGGSPFAVDWDNDGLTDLLVGGGSGEIVYYRNISKRRGMEFDKGRSLSIESVPGAAPFVVDWNNDGRKDLLIGGASGSVSLMLNNGTESAPAFGKGVFLESAGGVISVGSDAVPWVADWNKDGRKDLLIGSGAGTLSLFLNLGSDEAVELAPPVFILQTSGAVAPMVVDWNGDGARELLIAAGSRVSQTEKLLDDTYRLGKSILDPRGAWSRPGALGNDLRPFIWDADDAGGKDLLVGNGQGDLFWVHSNGNTFSPAFRTALKDKVAQLIRVAETEISPPNSALDQMLSDLSKAVSANGYRKVLRLASRIADAAAGTNLALITEELSLLLQ